VRRRHFLGLGAAAAIAPRMEAAPLMAAGGFDEPIAIESVSLFERGGDWFVRVRSADGAVGWSVGHPGKMELGAAVFTKVLAPFFVGKDARRIEALVDEVFSTGANYKMQGQLFWVPLAALEFAVLDLLGKVAGKPVAALFGGIRRRSIPLYIANNHRAHGAEESLQRIVASVDSIGATAVKFKLGGRMRVRDQVAGRTERLIPMVAEALGDRCTLYADANSSYVEVDDAVRVGRLLERHGFAFYEEPCVFDHLEETRRVAEALEIPVAWGEQESSEWRFRWMIENGGVQVPQPDLLYYGGLIRSLRVARLAAAAGLPCTPHVSGGGLGFLYMGIYASCVANPGAHQEYKGLTKSFPWESTGSPIVVEDGAMSAPDGIGLGVRIDPAYLAGAREVGA